jgi:hypothetical protein
MDVNLGDGMSSVIPICRIVRARNACADPRLTRAPSFDFAHDPSGLVNARRIELFGNGATELISHVAPTRPDG